MVEVADSAPSSQACVASISAGLSLDSIHADIAHRNFSTTLNTDILKHRSQAKRATTRTPESAVCLLQMAELLGHALGIRMATLPTCW